MRVGLRFAAGVIYALMAEEGSYIAVCRWGSRLRRTVHDDRNTQECPTCHERFDLMHAMWVCAQTCEERAS